jgi:hypothetical protein
MTVQSRVNEVKINLVEFSTNIIESPKISGLYVGWLRTDTQRWEPLVKLMEVEGGYTAKYTSNHEEISALYPGYGDLLIKFEQNVVKENFPHIFDSRMPLLRKDVKNDCEFLKLDYPQIDKIAYVSRYGGRISGDPFNICPIIEPDTEGNYTFYCTLSDVEEIPGHEGVWERVVSQLEEFYLVKIGNKHCLKIDDIILGYLEDYFDLINGEMKQIEIVSFTDPNKWQGFGIMLKIILHSNNAYAHKLFKTT